MGFFRNLEDDVKDLGRSIDDEIFEPVKNSVEAIADNPRALAGLALAIAFPGAGAALGSALGLGAGAVAQFVGQALINTAINGGDVKAAVISAAIPVVGKEASNLIGETLTNTGMDATVNRIITQGATQALTAELMGKDPLTAFLMGGVSAGVNAIAAEIPEINKLPPVARNALTSAIGTKLANGNVQGAVVDSLIKDAVGYATKSVQNFTAAQAKSPNFNVEAYSAAYPDLAAAFAGDFGALAEHYNNAGYYEGRQLNSWEAVAESKDPGFNPEAYAAAYQDLNDWIGHDPEQLAKHYAQYGQNEGRINSWEEIAQSKNPDFDAKAYKERYPDLAAAFKNDDQALAKHFATAGLSEGRDPTPYVTQDEAARIWRENTGTNPTEFDLLEITGLSKSQASNIAYDRATTSSDEAEEYFKNFYGKDYTPTTEQLMEVLGRPEGAAKVIANNLYAEDKNSVTKDEAVEFLKKAGLKESDVTQTQLESALKGSEPGVETFFQTLADRKATTFDGSDYERQSDAQAQAIRSGFNSYEWGGKDYTVMSPEQAKQLQADRASGKNVGVSPDQIFMPVPGKTLDQQLEDAGNPDEYAYQQGDTITIVAKRLAVPNYEDTEAWNAFKAEKKALGGDTFQTLLTEQFSILEQAMKGAPEDSVAKVMADAAMFGYGKMAQLAETFSRTGEAMGIPQAERGTNIAKQVQSWSKKLVDQGVQNAEAAVLANVAAVTKESIAAEKGVKPSDVSTAELYAQKAAALFKQVPNNPLGVSLFLVGEGIQEIPLLAVSGGVGSVFKNVIGKSVGMSAAVGTNVALNGAESFGGNYGEVKEYLTKRGVPASQIEALAVKSGLEGMAVGMLTSYVGDRALVKSFMGDLATDSFGKVVATNSAKEWFMGNFEGSLQNMSAQIGKYGSIKSEDEWLNAGIMEGFAQKGIAAGVLTAASLDKAVAKDYDGKPVTYKEVIEGTKTFDPKTLDKEFSFGNGVNLGDAIGYHSTFITNPDITPDEYFYAAQTFRENGMNDFTPQEIASIVGTPGEMSPEQISEIAQPYAQEKVVSPQEAQQMMRDLGYENFTDAEALSLAGQISEADARARVQEYVAPRQVTREEAADFFTSIPGYTPTQEDIDAFARQGADVNQETVRSEVAGYVDQRMVSEQEAKDAYAALGLNRPTQDDIAKLVGQYDQTGLTGKATENLDAARYNSLLQQIEQLGTQSNVDPATLETIKKDLNAQIAALGGDVTKLQSGLDSVVSSQAAAATQVADLQKSLSDEIQAAKDIGLQGDAAIQAGLDSLAGKVGTNQADLLAQLGTTAADLRTQFATDIATSQAATAQEIATTKTALETAIADAKASGLQGDAALKSAIDAVAASQQTSAADLLSKLGTTEAGLKTEFQAGLAGVSADVEATRTALTEAIKAAQDMGLQGDAALKAAIDSVAATQQTNAADLLGKLGTTEAGLKSEFAAGLAGVSAEVADTRKSLEDAIKAAQDMGLQGDAALRAGIDSVAAQLGTTKEALLSQLGTTEAGLRQEFASGLAGVQTQMEQQYNALTAAQKAEADARIAQGQTLEQAIAAAQAATTGQISGLEAQTRAQYESLTASQKAAADALVAQGQTLQNAITAAKTEAAGQIAGVETRLTDAIAAAEAMGLSRDQAITAAVDAVASDLGTTRAALLAQLGTTEAGLRQEFASGISGLEAQTKAQYDSLSAAQKATADALVAQGQSMQQAITAAQQQTAGQIAGVETRLTDAIAAAEAMGLSRDQAITAAVDSVAAELGTTRNNLLAQLGTTEAALRTEFGAGLAGVSAEVKTAYDSLSAEQKALANQLAQQGTDMASAIQQAQQQTQGQIGALSADMQAKYDAMTAAQKAETDARVAQGQTLQDAIAASQAATTGQIAGVNQQIAGLESQLTAQGTDFARQLAAQGMDYRTALQTAIAAQGQSFGTQISDLEARRQADVNAQLARERAAEEARAAQAAQAATAAKEAQRQATIRTTLGQGQQQLQQIAKQIPQALQQAQTTTTPIYGEMGPYLDIGSPLDFDFFKPSPEKQAATNRQQPTKIAAGGYIDDLLAEGMSVDDLLNLLR